MCKCNFYLKASNGDGKHLVYLQLKTKGFKVVSSTKLMINAAHWNSNTQRIKHNDNDYQNSLNNYLDKIVDEGERYHDVLLSQNILTQGNLKSALDKIIQFSKPIPPKQKVVAVKKRSPKKIRKENAVSPFLTRKQIAAIFGVKPRTLINWEKQGVINPVFYINGRPRYAFNDAVNIGEKNQTVYKFEKPYRRKP